MENIFFRDEKWQKTPKLLSTQKSPYGLWGIDKKEKMAILLRDMLIVEKKRRNPMQHAFDIVKKGDMAGVFQVE